MYDRKVLGTWSYLLNINIHACLFGVIYTHYILYKESKWATHSHKNISIVSSSMRKCTEIEQNHKQLKHRINNINNFINNYYNNINVINNNNYINDNNCVNDNVALSPFIMKKHTTTIKHELQITVFSTTT